MRSAETAAGAAALLATDEAMGASFPSGAVLGVDTEFMRTDTFFPIAAVYQVSDGGDTVLMDALAGGRFEPLVRALTDPGRLKVMHALSEDLEVLDTHLGLRPVNVVDTQLAHAFLHPEFGVSYAGLVERHLGVALAKHSTRSDWLRRPLSAAQIAYAREDVTHLVPLWHRLRDGLEAAGRLAWVMEEMQRLLGRDAPGPDEHYRTFGGLWRLSRPQLGVLRSLVAWREREARRRDVPRARTVRDEHLMAIARAEDAAGAIARAVPPRTRRRYGEALLDAVRRGLESDSLPAPAPPPFTRRQGEIAAGLRQFARDRAERLGMAPELLSRKRDIDACVRHYLERRQLPPWFGAWREVLVGEDFEHQLGRLAA